MKIFEKDTATRWIYGIILIIAVAFRLLNLNSVPLTNPEAQQALCAVDAERSGCDAISRIYLFFTDTLFTIFGSSNFSARVVPALLGSLIVILPLLLEPLLEKKTAVVLAICLALDPILIQTARAASDVMIGMVFILFLLVFLLKRNWSAAVVTFAFGLLSGKTFWIGFLITGMAYGVTWLLSHKEVRIEDHQEIDIPLFRKQNMHLLLILFLLWLGISTRLATEPSGLWSPVKALLSIFPGSTVGDPEMALSTDVRLVAFLFYAFYAIVFCIAAFFHTKKQENKKNLFLLVWILLGMVVFLIPQFSFYEAVWMCVPMWVMAAGCMVNIGSATWRERKTILVPFLVGIAILVFLSFQILRLHYLLSAGMELTTNLMLLVSPLLLCILFVLLYAYGWSWTRTVQVLSALFLVCGFFTMVRNANRSANITGTYEYELMREAPYLKNSDLLLEEIENYRTQKSASPKEITIALSMKERTESLQWALRNYSISVVDDPTALDSVDYDIFITNADASYTFNDHESENFVLSSDVAWVREDFSGFLPDEILEWLIYRTASLNVTSFSVWFKS